MKKEILVFTQGDSSLVKTWSNVPYFFTTTLEKKGYIVHRINTERFKFLTRCINKTMRVVFKSVTIDVHTMNIYRKFVNKSMKKAISKYPNSDLIISTDFNYSGAQITNKIPSLVYCDWTYEYLITQIQNRKPNIIERRTIALQNKQVEISTYVIALFPRVCEYMRNIYKNKNIYYIGNVINSDLYDVKETIIDDKLTSSLIVFIGGYKYKAAAEALIKAIKLYNINNDRNVVLNIIGMKQTGFEDNEFTKWHGYLDKNNSNQKKLYYDIIRKSKICINTYEQWSGFSSLVEAMYFYTPIITFPFGEMVETFGEKIKFGYYCKKNDASLIFEYISKIFNQDTKEYINMCLDAHKKVEDFTWDRYIDKLLGIVELRLYED
ncbi:glycosyltransferase [Clostridium estertheticum]|uniref:glycosyltransferase n=1 Tax=Clostridium estertheticum TaxID=238834 RepID=UPI00124BFDA6|nr:glycosyltransferase [Clostridium estertheticum]MBZ9616150.1 glycosyltransferase [Clostridium estertheticum subsp. laramiense]WAG71899.1 glycosyltransferase [Clostridium estertheticum]